MNAQKTVRSIIISLLFILAIPTCIAVTNEWFGYLQQVDDSTNYLTKKKVEDTCRSMIATYEADRLMYEQYRDSKDGTKQSWGEQAKIRANRTAASYNNYILQNSYVWKDNVPKDIREELPYLQ